MVMLKVPSQIKFVECGYKANMKIPIDPHQEYS